MNWYQTFRREYRDLLDPNVSGAKRGLHEGLYKRGHGFDIMFRHLNQQGNGPFHIIETGTMRNPGNWKDGSSALLFTRCVDIHGGWVHSVDIDPDACVRSREALKSRRFQVTCSDSVAWLTQHPDIEQVDLFYLDSYDVKWENDQPSAEHHLREFKAIAPRLKPGCLVAIDDNARRVSDNSRTGKGRLIVEYLDALGHRPIYDAYQIIYRMPGPCL